MESDKHLKTTRLERRKKTSEEFLSSLEPFFQDCSTFNNKAPQGQTMLQVLEQSWPFNMHTVLVFLCRRAVALAALLPHNGPQRGLSRVAACRGTTGQGCASSCSHLFM
ncbi:hypothetical protein GOODEAATRI_011229 [Goodea atripinnis]|uniref:Uncharacterized protein n=1 Tax=Goodea atripinnis TaxID=208336 RepID=A0ABV0MGX1_9TELE